MSAPYDSRSATQDGMVLVTTLLLLIVITLLALAMFRGAGLDNRIAGNVLDKQRALQAAQKIERESGRQIEILDLRTLAPYDWAAIAASVKKTARALVAHEDMLSWGYGAEIAARIGEELFEYLDAPVRRAAAQDLFCAYQPALEDAILPQSEDLYRIMTELLAY